MRQVPSLLVFHLRFLMAIIVILERIIFGLRHTPTLPFQAILISRLVDLELLPNASKAERKRRRQSVVTAKSLRS